jgi:hypothetical protein
MGQRPYAPQNVMGQFHREGVHRASSFLYFLRLCAFCAWYLLFSFFFFCPKKKMPCSVAYGVAATNQVVAHSLFYILPHFLSLYISITDFVWPKASRAHIVNLHVGDAIKKKIQRTHPVRAFSAKAARPPGCGESFFFLDFGIRASLLPSPGFRYY